MKHRKIIAIFIAVAILVFIGNKVFLAQEDAVISEKFSEPITSISVWLDAKEKTSFAKDEAQQEEIRQELAQYGTYIYEVEEVSLPSCNTSDDVTLYTPMVFYQAWEKTWTVTCGGNWKSTSWRKRVFIGEVGDDAFGVKYSDSTQAYRSYVVRASAYLADEDTEKKVTTYYRSDGDGSKGFSFRLQDYTYFVPFKTGYVGYKWYGSCTYDSGFGAYDGVATAYYFPT